MAHSRLAHHLLRAAALLALCGSATAAPITALNQLSGSLTTINFDSLAAGGQASPLVFGGVTISGALSVIDVDAYGASVTFPDYVDDKALGIPRAAGQTPVFTISFATAVSQVGFGLFDPNFAGNQIRAYDGGGNLLETTAPDYLDAPGGSAADYLGFSRSGADIARIEISAGISGGVLDALWIDNLSYGVPLPGSLPLVAAGLLVAAAATRRRG